MRSFLIQKNESASAGIVTHMRSGRKFNNDQIAIAIDTEKDDHVIDDEDDDKGEFFFFFCLHVLRSSCLFFYY